MDGLRTLSIRLAVVSSLALAPLGCAEIDPTPDPLPFEMYDSPLIASSDHEAAPPERLPPVEDDATETDTATVENEESDEPDESAGDEQTSETATAEASDDGARETEETSDSPETPALSSTRQAEPEPEAEPAATSSAAPSASDRPPPEPDADDGGTNADAARYAAAIYELNEVAIPGEAHADVPALYRHCREQEAVFQSREPKPGDLVFFHNVEDANGDGRNNDWYTLVGLVEGTDASGTVSILAYRDGKVRTVSMNLDQPDQHRTGGTTTNTRLREKSSDDPPFTQYLAGQLFAGYCSLLGDRSELLVVDNWRPGMELERPD